MARHPPDPGPERPSAGGQLRHRGAGRSPAAAAASASTVVAGGLWQVASSLVPRIQILVISVVAARVLGPEDMGRQSYISFVAMSFVALATGGFPFALSRYVGRSVGEGRPELVGPLYGRTWRIEVFSAIGAAAAVVAVGCVRGELFTAWAWAAGWAVVMILHTVPANLLGGLQRWSDVSRVTLMTGLVTAAGVIAALLAGGGITAMFAFPALVGVVSVVWTRVLADRAARPMGHGSGVLPRALQREARGYVALMTVQVVLTFVVWQRSEFWFLDRYGSATQIAVYSIAFSAVLSLGRVPFALANVAFPALATLDGAGDAHRVRSGVNRILRVQLLAALPMTALFVAAGPLLLSTVYGDEYDATGTVLQVLMVGFPLLPLALTGGAVLMGLGRLRSLVGIYAAGAALNLAIDRALIPQHGAVGAAWANTIAQSVIGLALAVAVHRIVGGLEVDAGRLARGAMVSAIAIAPGLWVADSVTPSVPALVASASLVVVGCWAGGGVAHVFRSSDVAWLADAVGERLGRRGSTLVRIALRPFG